MARGGATSLKAYALAAIAMTLFCVEAALARLIGPDIDVAQVIIVRSIIQLGFLMIWLRFDVKAIYRTDRLSLHLTRGMLNLTGLAAYYYVFATMPIATATVILFSGVLCTALAASVFLREDVGWRRWLATFGGFAGVLLVVRPEATPLNLSLLAGLYLAVNQAGTSLTTKGLTRTEPTHVIMAWIATIMFAAALPVALLWPSVPTSKTVLIAVCVGLFGTIGQLTSVVALRMADVSALAPIHYLRIVLASAIGYWFFAETIDLRTVIGASVVTFSALYITIHESRAARAADRT
jgi:drug/metabolite transporter (DMT)-like permease